MPRSANKAPAWGERRNAQHATTGARVRRIAFIGLGAMGRRMVARLVDGGFTVSGYDVNPAARDAVAALGARLAASAANAAHDADVVILMVVDAAQAARILFEDGVVHALAAGRPPSFSRQPAQPGSSLTSPSG